MMMKKQNGITLIALVITIIVLLILAGVSIAMLTGDNGILTKAGESKVKSQRAEADETLKLAINVVLADKLDPSVTDENKKDINLANIQAAKNNSNVTFVEGTGTPDAGTILIDAKIADKTYNFSVNTTTGEVIDKTPTE